MKSDTPSSTTTENVSRRNFLGAGTAAVATAAFSALAATAQEPEQTRKAEIDQSSSDPGQENKILLDENPSSNAPPPTDHGDVGPIWYSFDLVHKRIEEGGWTHQVTQRELPSSTELTGVNMRLTSGSYRELHWHTADEWAMMLYGKARVTVMNPDGTMFVDDIAKNDLWYFPAGYPHSIQGLGPDGCEFLLVFDEGSFSEDNTFLISEWVAHTPGRVLAKNFGLGRDALAKLPKEQLYIFPGTVPQSLAMDRSAVGGRSVESPYRYTFRMDSMQPTKQTAGGEVRVVDSHNFAASKHIAAGLVTIRPGGMRELHWHPNASEWQFYIAGTGRMTVFRPGGQARTMDFNANDVGFVPLMAGHYVENIGDSDLVFLEMFRAHEFVDFSLNNWIRRLPPQLAAAHLNLDAAAIRKIPADKEVIIAG